MSGQRPLPQPLTDSRLLHRVLLLAGLLIGFALRLTRLGAESLWYDETVSVVLARKGVAALIAHTAGDIHPPGYYLLLHFWQALTQPTLAHGLESLFAWPSLWFGLLILPLLYALGRRIFDRRVGLMALWLASVHPFHLWYSQEVRMYTLGAFLGMLCLWALVKALDTPTRSRLWLLLYAVSAAAGLYVLYYFLFLLAALNLMAITILWQRAPGRQILGRKSGLWPWGMAQMGALLLWTPWLPTFLRQAQDPPVPPWRIPWQSLGEFAHTLTEVLAAQLVGQSPPGAVLWPYALLTVGLIFAGFGYAKRTRKLNAAALVSGHALLPLALIFLLTLLATPLYHVRYAFTYAPPLLLLFAAGLAGLPRPHLRGIALAALLFLGAAGSATMWSQPDYRADDHRSAVAELAQTWRPGDVILVNAGWGYTILETYWPTELTGPDGSAPPHLGPALRLGDPLPPAPGQETNPVPLVRGGSVDGGPSLGWGDAASDFFPISQAETIAALDDLAANFNRLWHYRIYDTVSDPQGVIRDQLAAQGAPLLDHPIPGRDFARLQLFGLDRSLDEKRGTPPDSMPGGAWFGDVLHLAETALPDTVHAGEFLYVQGVWQPQAPLAQLGAELAVSLRLMDAEGRTAAQQDAGFLPAARLRPPSQSWVEWFALPLPAALTPGTYQVQLIVYSRADGLPLAATPAEGGDPHPALALGQIVVNPPVRPVPAPPTLARFDYIHLLEAEITAQITPGGQAIDVDLLWLPRPQGYQDTYTAILTLTDERGQILAQLQDPLGGWAYPSGDWPGYLPVRDHKRLHPDQPFPPGTYPLTLAVIRSADGQTLPPRTGRWTPNATPAALTLGTITIP